MIFTIIVIFKITIIIRTSNFPDTLAWQTDFPLTPILAPHIVLYVCSLALPYPLHKGAY